MSRPFTVACVQTTSAREVGPSVEAAEALVLEAAEAGADFVLLPETVNLMEPKGRLMRDKARAEDADLALKAFRALAKDAAIWLLAGSLVVKPGGDEAGGDEAGGDEAGDKSGDNGGDGDKLANRSFLIDPDGNVVARYDKIHMFDVDLGSGESYRESKTYRSGGALVTAELPWGRLGMTICYDLRFPHLYRALAKAGADFVAVPSAFTRPTGKAHWEVLLRARAIENGCFVFAPAQCGEHEGGRKTHGHSLIVDPWGQVLADGGEKVGFVTARIEPEAVAEARAKIPSLTHDRDFEV